MNPRNHGLGFTDAPGERTLGDSTWVSQHETAYSCTLENIAYLRMSDREYDKKDKTCLLGSYRNSCGIYVIIVLRSAPETVPRESRPPPSRGDHATVGNVLRPATLPSILNGGLVEPSPMLNGDGAEAEGDSRCRCGEESARQSHFP